MTFVVGHAGEIACSPVASSRGCVRSVQTSVAVAVARMARGTTSLACLTDETKTNENNATSCCLLGNIMRIHLRENDAK